MNRRHFAQSLLALPALASQGVARKTKNVIVVMADGLRWQEAFRGVDPALMNKQSGVAEVAALTKRFARDTPAASREAILPFLWTVVARQGQIFGNRDLGSDAWVTNGMNFSYPGYSEAFCGFGDPRVDSNDKKLNPNVNVLEHLNKRPGFAGKVAAFGAWELFPWILNAERSGVYVNAGLDPMTKAPVSERTRLLNRVRVESAIWDSEALDAPVFHTALDYFRQHKPRVFFVSLGETDEWAHEGRYDLYLRAANLFDGYARELWETAQAMPSHRGSTSLILAVDHGRGEAPTDWKSHGQKLPESKYVWMGFLGPDTKPLGERKNVAPVTQNQIAPTIAALLGEEFRAAAAGAGTVLGEVVGL